MILFNHIFKPNETAFFAMSGGGSYYRSPNNNDDYPLLPYSHSEILTSNYKNTTETKKQVPIYCSAIEHKDKKKSAGKFIILLNESLLVSTEETLIGKFEMDDITIINTLYEEFYKKCDGFTNIFYVAVEILRNNLLNIIPQPYINEVIAFIDKNIIELDVHINDFNNHFITDFIKHLTDEYPPPSEGKATNAEISQFMLDGINKSNEDINNTHQDIFTSLPNLFNLLKKYNYVLDMYHNPIERQGYFIQKTFSDLRKYSKNISSFVKNIDNKTINNYETNMLNDTLYRKDSEILKHYSTIDDFKIKKIFNILINIRLDFKMGDIKYSTKETKTNKEYYKNINTNVSIDKIYILESLYDGLYFSSCLSPYVSDSSSGTIIDATGKEIKQLKKIDCDNYFSQSIKYFKDEILGSSENIYNTKDDIFNNDITPYSSMIYNDITPYNNTFSNNVTSYNNQDNKYTDKYFNILYKLNIYNKNKLHFMSIKNFNDKIKNIINNDNYINVLNNLYESINSENMNKVLTFINKNNNVINNNTNDNTLYLLMDKLNKLSEKQLIEILNYYSDIKTKPKNIKTIKNKISNKKSSRKKK